MSSNQQQALLTVLKEYVGAIESNRVKKTDDLLFERGYNEMIENHCNEKFKMAYYLKNYHTALREARSNKLHSAEKLIERAHLFVDFGKLTEAEKIIYQSISLPIDAYLCYKRSMYALSIEKLEETIRLDWMLEEEHPIVLFHRIQQLHNIYRIKIRQGRFTEAFDLIIILFSLLISEIDVHYHEHFFDASLSSTTTLTSLKNAMIDQIFAEVTYDIDKCTDEQSKEQFLTNITAFNNELHNEINRVALWGRFKHLANQNKRNEYLLTFMSLIAHKEVFHSEILVRSIVNDLKQLYDKTNEVEMHTQLDNLLQTVK